MRYLSTRARSPKVSASAAILRGLAPDGGLYIPESWPLVSLGDQAFASFAAEVLRPFFAGDALEPRLDEICRRAFDFPVVLKSLDHSTALLELFHGPTHAFKDFGARFLANCLNELTAEGSSRQRLVLVATSGDTGGAVAAAFCQCTEIPVVILYPQGKISARQEKQLTSWGAQVRAFAVKGTFDDCQRIVKEAFVSPDWQRRFELVSANSINLARLLPQMCYFAFASRRYLRETGRTAGLIVPSGNLGNAVAALWARRSGAPIARVICAHNANRAVANFFATRQWQALATVATLANAMDVGNPSNFERMRALGTDDDLLANAGAYSVSDEEIRQTIVAVFRKYREVICPHTAAGFFAREKLSSGEWIIAATAHPAKFESIVEPLLGISIEVPRNLRAVLDAPSSSTVIGASLADLEREVWV